MPKDHFRLSWASIHLLLFKYMMILENSKILFGKHLSAFFCKKPCIKLGGGKECRAAREPEHDSSGQNRHFRKGELGCGRGSSQG